MIAEDDAPANIKLTGTFNCYGNLIKMGENMSFLGTYNTGQLNLRGGAADGQIINKGASAINLLIVNNASARWTFTNDMIITSRYSQTAADNVTFAMNTLTGGKIQMDNGVLNLNVTEANLRAIDGTMIDFIFSGGTVNASNLIMRLSSNFSSGGTGVKYLNIENSTITTGRNWTYTGASSVLSASGSSISSAWNFGGQNGHEYNIVETSAGTLGGMYTIAGDLMIKKLILNHPRNLTGSNTIDTLLMRPKGLTLYLADGTMQTVTDNLLISGSPCLFNTIRAGAETCSTQTSATATINYTNASDNSVYDYVRIGGIIASGNTLTFDVNSSSYGLNTNVVFLPGTPGLVGLPDDYNCKAPTGVTAADSLAAYAISAAAFYGNDLSTYKWYKKNSAGTFVRLSEPSTAVAIDTRKYGRDGTYRVEIVYDSTVTTPCTSNDQISVTFAAPTVMFGSGNATDTTFRFCSTDTLYVIDLKSNFISLYAGEYMLKSYDALSGGNELTDSLKLTNADYYFSFLTDSGCYSPVRSRIAVTIDQQPVANAGSDITQNNNPLFTMAATAPLGNQTGEWTVISGTATIANPTSPTTQVTLDSSSDYAILQWKVTNGTCEDTDTVMIGEKTVVPRANPNVRIRVK
jgi:hypothetical protein